MGEPGSISISCDCFAFQYNTAASQQNTFSVLEWAVYLTNDSNNFLLRQFPVFQAWYCIIGPGLNFVIVAQKSKHEMHSSSFSITWHQTFLGYDPAVR